MSFILLTNTKLLFLLFAVNAVRGWTVFPHQQSKRHQVSTRSPLALSQRPEESSQMSQFIRNFLNENHKDDWTSNDRKKNMKMNRQQSTQKYLIAVPMETCHELALELESIQRAILYHCPILVHACIPAAALRLPLLQLEMKKEEVPNEALQQLQECIETVLQQPELQQEPWMVSWKGLEGNNVDNSVLFATSDYVSPCVNSFVQSLNQTLLQQSSSWTLSWAREQKQETELRLPFLQLPDDWEMILKSAHNITADDDNNQRYTLTSDQGGNGISPLFWIQYMDDALGLDHLRLPEIGLYALSGENKALASWPSVTWPLPVGSNQTILRREREFQDYQEGRIQKAEKSLKNSNQLENQEEPRNAYSEPRHSEEDDIILSKTRQRLEQVYGQSVSEAKSNDALSNVDDRENVELDSILEPNKPESPPDPAALDGWMREKIQNVIASRARERSLQQLSTKKDKPAIENNPIFAQYKNGTLIAEKSQAPSTQTPVLPPYPSREHLVGFWRMVRSPTGFEPMENNKDQSENLILRVDGTTAGGPILDPETQQKAAGGTWAFSGETDATARLLIRLQIPPKKERVLVMEGALERLSTKGQAMPLPSNTFSIPALEDLKSRNKNDAEDFIFCRGNVWIEDASSGRNRDDIGTFSIMKLNLSKDPSQYTITVPRPVRNQD
ncbi:hypothetical protein FisN_13Lh012 [Fistulifera solaris]|uniref:A-kinase anchor protein 7-like phosphoesterase domain-containing protein n=1 Tax=Fistulifera solaris TaxID=1519565 RepID=A0A1Z5JEX9_FISSO|nr:hypothetical protein FisN_13Lh012 [Fistulifera solaris]|eukprot:GAX12563.1 hypothetical protein FisN_13Lh012 [Fistulifera solaris]